MLEFRSEGDQLKLFRFDYVIEGITALKTESKKANDKFDLILDDKFFQYRYPEVTFRELWSLNVHKISVPKYLKIGGIEISIYFKETRYGCIIEKNNSSWTNFYSFEDYISTFVKLLEKEDSIQLVSSQPVEFICFDKTIGSKGKIKQIETKIGKIRDFIYHFHIKSLERLEKSYSNNTIFTLFSFPDELKISCKQYLLYFAQFLQDLGLNATSDVKEEAGKVLFSVTPNDDIDALDKIREALAIYLNLPSSPVLYNDSFQSMQLKQQVENLQHSQRMQEMEMRSAQYALRLAQQNIENQDKIITRQNSFIDNQNKIIEKITSKSIMIDSLENKEELEKFCEGFEVGKSEFLIKHFGLHLNPATVLKNIGKKIIGKEEERISILDSGEETDKK